MRRVLASSSWGKYGDDYVGKSLELFRDPTVKYSGEEVGGIQISKMSDIQNQFVFMLTLSRGKKRPIIIKPLESKKEFTIEERREKTLKLFKEITPEIETAVNACNSAEELKAVYEANK
jgi:hypothetical protein